MPPVFVDARTLADRLDVRYETLLTWVRRGRLPHIRDGRGRLLFNLNSVVEAIRQQPASNTASPNAKAKDKGVSR